jgi:hypothetical protein
MHLYDQVRGTPPTALALASAPSRGARIQTSIYHKQAILGSLWWQGKSHQDLLSFPPYLLLLDRNLFTETGNYFYDADISLRYSLCNHPFNSHSVRDRKLTYFSTSGQLLLNPSFRPLMRRDLYPQGGPK